MTEFKISRIWTFYFFCGFIIFQVHFLRYLNSFLTGYTPWADKYIDYGFITIEGLLTRLICFIFSLFIFQIKVSKPITASSLIWTICFLLLSNEHDKNTFFSILIISLFSYSCCIYLFLKKKLNDI